MILALFPVLIFRLLLLDDRKGGTKDIRFEIQKTLGYFLYFSRSTAQSFIWLSSETTVVQLEYMKTFGIYLPIKVWGVNIQRLC